MQQCKIGSKIEQSYFMRSALCIHELYTMETYIMVLHQEHVMHEVEIDIDMTSGS